MCRCGRGMRIWIYRNCYKTEQLILEDGKQFFRYVTPNPSVHSNEYYENRIYHTDQIVEILKDVAMDKGVLLIDNYQFILDYLAAHEQKIDDIIFNADGGGDGLHPSDFVQKLMFENIISELDI